MVKKSLSKIFAALIVISMIMSLLPAQFVSAAEEAKNPADYSRYGTLDEMKASGYSGFVYELKEETGTNYDHVLTFGVYNMDPAEMYQFEILYNKNDVELKRTDKSNTYAGSHPQMFYQLGTVTDSMVEPDGLFAGESMTNLFATENNITIPAYEADSNYYRLEANLIVNSGLSRTDWSNEDTGAKLADGAIELHTTYKFPDNEIVPVMTMQFKVNNLKEDTFKIYYNSLSKYCGARGVTQRNNPDTSATQTVLNDGHNEGVYFVGFPKPEVAPVSVNFTKVKNSSGTGLFEADVTLYTDSNMTTVAKDKDGTELKGRTDNQGALTINNVPASTTYFYKITKTGYETSQAETNKIDVGTSDFTVPEVELIAESEATHPVEITVYDKDTDTALSGATVSIEGTALTDTTNASGKVTTNKTVGTYTVSASKAGYTTDSSSLTVNSSGGSATIKLVPERISAAIPVVKDGNGATIAADVSVRKTQGGTTNAWSDTTVKTKADGSATNIDVPKNSTFSLTFTTTGYSSYTLYMKTDGSTSTLYKDALCTQPFTVGADDVTIQKMGDPYYDVQIDPAADGSGTYTATVTLNNINALYGTFGIRYDKDVLTLDNDNDFTLDSDLMLYNVDNPTTKPQVAVNTANETVGYHVFSWAPKDVERTSGVTSLDTTSAAKTVATYQFKLKPNKTAADIDSDTFAVMPYDKTALATSYIAAKDQSDPYFVESTWDYLNNLWRYVDEENQDPLGDGRLDESKASNKGFYQVGCETDGLMYDVMTIFHFEASESVLVFEAVDDNNFAIDGVDVVVTANDGTSVTLTTDSTGIATMNVDTSNGPVTYQYTATRPGYWDVPLTSVTVASQVPPVTTIEYITMHEKIYHPTKLKDSTSTGPVENRQDVANASLRGDAFAYNGRDYHFNIDPDPGYTFDPNAVGTITAYVKDVDTGNYEPHSVTYDANNDVYVLAGSEIVGIKLDPQNPDANGFKSDDIYITIDPASITVSNEKFKVEAFTNGGTVAYNSTPQIGSQQVNTAADNKTITVSDIAALEDTNDFTFTADQDNTIEKVIINGVVVDVYNGKTSLEYKFEDITEDCSIAVIFTDGTTPSTDSMITLVVGEKGKVSTTAPSVVTDITNKRATFKFDNNGTVTFSATPDAGVSGPDVKVKVNDGALSPLNPTGSDYTVTSNAGENVVVYISFGTSNVFVKSYIYSGYGMIDPIGELIYHKYDSPIFTMEAFTNYMLTGVMLDNNQQYDYPTQRLTDTYQLQSVTANASIGAIFSEQEYTVHGIVDLAEGQTGAGTLEGVVLNSNRGADIKFVRISDNETFTTTSSNASRKNSTFDIDVPEGMYTVTVSKLGYLNYTITKFTVSPAALTSGSVINFGAVSVGDDPKPIVPLIGDTSGKGLSVNLGDATVIATGLRTTNNDIRRKGDVADNDGVATIEDMVYVKRNYSERQIKKTYSDFIAGN